jgi:murein DD-endopeptidase MepM/ murein hydrolase activator NlpD
VVHGFERPPAPWLPGHRGVDLAGSPGQLVLSADAGTIAYAGPLAGRGVVVVSHGLTRTTYEPVVASVRTGATVTAGEPIGRLSAAGSHCSPAVCLHWGLRRGDEYLDPLSLLDDGPVRLLPLTDF